MMLFLRLYFDLLLKWFAFAVVGVRDTEGMRAGKKKKEYY